MEFTYSLDENLNIIELIEKGHKMNIELINMTEQPEKVIETAARTCYQSQYKGDGCLIKALIKNGHHSALEHASATFKINGVSRAMTHQLVRHRLCSFSQQSQRYVNESQFDYVVPPSILEMPEQIRNQYYKHMSEIQKMYDYWKKVGLKNEDARFVLPNACCSEIVITANFREWRTIFGLRCDKHAQWEIRKAMTHCLMILNKSAPNVFYDLAEKYLVSVE